MLDFTVLAIAIALIAACGSDCAFSNFLESRGITSDYVYYVVYDYLVDSSSSARIRVRDLFSSVSKSAAICVGLIVSAAIGFPYAAYRYFRSIDQADGRSSDDSVTEPMTQPRPMRQWGGRTLPQSSFEERTFGTAGSDYYEGSVRSDDDEGSIYGDSFNPNDIPISASRRMGPRWGRQDSPSSPPVLDASSRPRFGVSFGDSRVFDRRDSDEDYYRRSSQYEEESEHSRGQRWTGKYSDSGSGYSGSNHQRPAPAPVTAPALAFGQTRYLCTAHRTEGEMCSHDSFLPGVCPRAQQVNARYNAQLNTAQALHDLQQSMVFGMERLHAENIRREEERQREAQAEREALQRILAERDAQAKRDHDRLVLSTRQAVYEARPKWGTIVDELLLERDRHDAKYGPGPVSLMDIWLPCIQISKDRERLDREACLDVDKQLGTPPPSLAQVSKEWMAYDSALRPQLWSQILAHMAQVDAQLAMAEERRRAAMLAMRQPVYVPQSAPASYEMDVDDQSEPQVDPSAMELDD